MSREGTGEMVDQTQGEGTMKRNVWVVEIDDTEGQGLRHP